jgi:DNA-binding MarR family transcriptional regulator
LILPEVEFFVVHIPVRNAELRQLTPKRFGHRRRAAQIYLFADWAFPSLCCAMVNSVLVIFKNVAYGQPSSAQILDMETISMYNTTMARRRQDPDVPEYLPSLGRLLEFATHACSALCEKRLRRHGLTLPHWVILTALWRQDGMKITEISAYYTANLAALSKTLDRMEDKGLVRRRPDKSDRRAVRIFLTTKSKKLSHLLDFYKEINDALLRGFTKSEKAALFDMLERIAENAHEATI